MQREGDSHSPASTEQRGSRTDGGAMLVCDSVEVGDRVGRKRGGHAWPSGEPMSGGLPQSLLRGSGPGVGGRRKRGLGGSLQWVEEAGVVSRKSCSWLTNRVPAGLHRSRRGPSPVWKSTGIDFHQLDGSAWLVCGRVSLGVEVGQEPQ